MKQLLILTALILLFSLTGILGNGSVSEVNKSIKEGNPAFESSQARARFAQTKAIIDDGTINIDRFSEIVFPDIAYGKGHYYPNFLPGTSLLAIPFYVIGKQFQMAVIATNLLIPLVVLIEIFVMYRALLLLQFSKPLSVLCSFLTIFATDIFVYSTSLNAHPVSALSATIVLYASLLIYFKKDFNWGWLLLTLGAGLGMLADYPNFFTLAPFCIYGLIISYRVAVSKKRTLNLSLYHFAVAGLIAVGFVALLFWYSQAAFGSILTNIHSHEIRGYIRNGQPIYEVSGNPADFANYQVIYSGLEIDVLNTLPGLIGLLFSPARGLFFYFPLLILSFWGVKEFIKKSPGTSKTVFTAIILTLLIYSSYKFSSGGWSYGTRYLIGITPLMIVLMAFAVKKNAKNQLFKILFFILGIYSIAVSCLGGLTSRNLPSPLDISPVSGQLWGWGISNSFFRNFQLLLNEKQQSSFLYNHILSGGINLLAFYLVILGVLIMTFLFLAEKAFVKDS